MSGFAGCAGAFVFLVVVLGVAFAACSGAVQQAAQQATNNTSSSLAQPALATPDATPEPTPVPTPSCICATIDKLQMTVTGVNRHPALTSNIDGGPAAAGHTVGSGWVDDPSYHWVVVNVSFTNLPGATGDEDVGTGNTGSLDAFTVVGTDGLVVGPQVNFSNGCPTWSATIAQTGGSYGPKPLCFSIGGNVNGPITLRWSRGFSDTETITLAP